MQLTFRPLTETDYPLATEMKKTTVRDATGNDTLFAMWFPPERPFDAHLRKLQAFDPASCVFALLDGEIVGHLHLMMVEDGSCGYLNDIYLKPAYRGRGLGEQLHAYALAFFRTHGARRAQMRTNPANTKLMAFYTRMGWRETGPARHGMVQMENRF